MCLCHLLYSPSSYLSYPLFSFLGLEVYDLSKFIDTQASSISTEEFLLPRPDGCALTCLCCNGYILLLSSYLTRFGRIENPSFRACVLGHLSSHSALSSYGLFALLALWQLSVSLRSLVHALENCAASGAPWSSTMPPFFKRGLVTTTRQSKNALFSLNKFFNARKWRKTRK